MYFQPFFKSLVVAEHVRERGKVERRGWYTYIHKTYMHTSIRNNNQGFLEQGSVSSSKTGLMGGKCSAKKGRKEGEREGGREGGREVLFSFTGYEMGDWTCFMRLYYYYQLCGLGQCEMNEMGMFFREPGREDEAVGIWTKRRGEGEIPILLYFIAPGFPLNPPPTLLSRAYVYTYKRPFSTVLHPTRLILTSLPSSASLISPSHNLPISFPPHSRPIPAPFPLSFFSSPLSLFVVPTPPFSCLDTKLLVNGARMGRCMVASRVFSGYMACLSVMIGTMS